MLVLSPSDFKQLGDLQKFPILTKEEIRENWLGLVAIIFLKKILFYLILVAQQEALDFY